MSETKQHTPGPWFCTKAKHGIDGGDYEIAYVAIEREDRSLIIHAPMGHDDQGDANAHLISAAPELLEGLKLALEYWGHRQQRYNNRHPAWVQTARAAIAKATGA